MAAANDTSSTHDRYVIGLDLIRFCAALIVAIFHLTWRFPDTYYLMPVGWIGVQIFFVISGVVIANSANGASPASFLIGRACRLYPCAWLVLPLSCAAIYVGGADFQELRIRSDLSLSAVISSAILLNKGGGFIVGSYWTLPVEIAFYAVVLILISADSLRRLPVLAAGLTLWSAPFAIVSALEAFDAVSTAYGQIGYGLKNALLFRHGHYFAIGLLIYLTRIRPLNGFERATYFAAVALACLEIAARAEEIIPLFAGGFGRFGWQTIAISGFFSWLAAVLAIQASLIFNPAAIDRSSFRVAARHLGLVTYPLYLLHEPVGGLFLISLRRVIPDTSITLVLAILGLIAVSSIVVHYGEPPLRKLLSRNLWTLARYLALRFNSLSRFMRPTQSVALLPDSSSRSP